MPKPFIEAAVLNNKGSVRQNNEDSFYLDGVYMEKDDMDKGGLFRNSCDATGQIYAVCDGMGGEAAGEEASFTAVKCIAKNRGVLKAFDKSATLTEFVRNLSDAVYEIGKRRNARSGSTLTLMLVKEGSARLLHVGDSRIYRMRDHALTQMTVDHSEVQRMISLGVITKEESREHPKRHVISQYLGMPPQEIKVDPGISDPLPLLPGDRYLLCSDGLTDMVEDSVIETFLSKATTAAEACDILVRQALKNGGKDNVTVMTLFIGKLGTVNDGKWRLPLTALAGAGFLALLIELIYRLM